VDKRAYAPGQHGQSTGRRRKASQYSRQLREKQKVKRIYGLTEGQFHNTFKRVLHEEGMTGTNLLVALETRLDNVVYRMGFASSRKSARQLVRHGHVEVGGRAVDIPSYQVKPGVEVRMAKGSRDLDLVAASLELAARGQPVSWIAVDREARVGRVTERPTRDAIPIAAEEQLIVELYSK
jgi:small subunit ribosomal protein S4